MKLPKRTWLKVLAINKGIVQGLQGRRTLEHMELPKKV